LSPRFLPPARRASLFRELDIDAEKLDKVQEILGTESKASPAELMRDLSPEDSHTALPSGISNLAKRKDHASVWDN
jgi:hypothetical protein